MIVGIENSGTRAVESIFVNRGIKQVFKDFPKVEDAFKDSKQKELFKNEDILFARRSIPHADEWLDFEFVESEAEKLGCIVIWLILIREHKYLFKSKFKRNTYNYYPHFPDCANEANVEYRIRDCYNYIFSQLLEIEGKYCLLSTSLLFQYREKFLDNLNWIIGNFEPSDFKDIYDADLKWMSINKED
jgi:hypothetical protein